MTVIDKGRDDSIPLDITQAGTNSCLQKYWERKGPKCKARKVRKWGDAVIAASPPNP